MPLKFYGHPFSSYTQKALVALYENNTPFEFQVLSPDHPQIAADFARLWPLKRFPILDDAGETITESSVVIEYLQTKYPGPVRFIPTDPKKALEVRMLDRFFDNYISTPMQKVVFDAIRKPETRDAFGVAEARQLLDTAYRWLDKKMKDREWAAGCDFSLADCAAAPALFYADWVHAIAPEFTQVLAYRKRLLARPSFARAVNEARPYRAFFPLGVPNRD